MSKGYLEERAPIEPFDTEESTGRFTEQAAEVPPETGQTAPGASALTVPPMTGRDLPETDELRSAF